MFPLIVLQLVGGTDASIVCVYVMLLANRHRYSTVVNITQGYYHC